MSQVCADGNSQAKDFAIGVVDSHGMQGKLVLATCEQPDANVNFLSRRFALSVSDIELAAYS